MTSNPQSKTGKPDVAQTKKLIMNAPIGDYIGDDGAQILAERACNTIRLRDGDYLFRQGEETTSFYLLESGRLALLKNGAKGKDARVLHTLQQGDLVGELSFIDETPHVRSIIAIEDVTVLQFRAKDVRPLIDEHPQLMFDFMRAIIKRVHLTMQDITKQQLALADYISTGGKGRL